MSILLFLLFTKHFVVDFLLQGPYQYKNKGTYGHSGGILHAVNHGVATTAIIWYVAGPVMGICYGWVDAFVHYHIDWTKMNLCRIYNLKPDNSEKFWWLLGLDQFLHSLTYLVIVWSLFNGAF